MLAQNNNAVSRRTGNRDIMIGFKPHDLIFGFEIAKSRYKIHIICAIRLLATVFMYHAYFCGAFTYINLYKLSKNKDQTVEVKNGHYNGGLS